MARIVATGRSTKIVYGAQPVFSFRIQFPTPNYSNTTGLNPNWGGTTWDSFEYASNAQNTSSNPTTGTLTIAGITVTLAAKDILNPAAVATQIAATSITGFTAWINANANQPDVVFLQSTTPGSAARPTLALGTATNILFVDLSYVNGTAISIGAQDDILVRGRTPIQILVTNTGGTTPDVQTSVGTDTEQAAGQLTYAAALTLTSGAVTITTPVDYIRVTTKASNTQATLYIDR